MSENDFKKTYSGFTKFVLWGTLAVIAILVILAITPITLIIKKIKNDYWINQRRFILRKKSSDYS